MAAGIGHELNQPLTAINNFAATGRFQLDHDATSLEKLNGLLVNIEQQAKRAGHIIRMLKNMSQPTSESRNKVRINDLINGIVDLMKPDLRKNAVTTQLNLSGENPTILVDEIQIQQVFMNLIRNASDAMANETGDRNLNITTEVVENKIAITVADSSPGISSEASNELFNPFYTTKSKGTGVGLSISRSIIEAHGDTIRLLSTEPKGASLHLDLPLMRATPPEPHFQKSAQLSRKI